MARRRKKFIFSLVYLTMLIGIGWQGYQLYKFSRSAVPVESLKSLQINVSGNVRRPGFYHIPEGTTHFEILKVAGVRPTSDISGLNLTGQLEQNETVNVGTLASPVKIETGKSPPRLEFFLGEINIIASDGRNTPQHEGLVISKGDRILTESSAQAEISFGSSSRIDIDNFSELVFDKIGELENGRSTVELFQRSGTCWYKTTYANNNDETFRVMTHSAKLTISSSGADFLVEVTNDRIQINLLDGLILLERQDNSEAINLISGQSVVIHRDGRPFEVTRVSENLSNTTRFAKLNKEKINYMSRLLPFNILFCGTPAIFYVISFHYESNTLHLVRIPPEMLIEHFSQGISTLDQAYLYGGPVFVSTFVERMLDIRILKYCVLDKSDIVRIAGAMGGLQVPVDEKAASSLGMTTGSQKLSGNNLLLYLSPSISGIQDCYSRQSRLIESIFDSFRSNSTSMSLVLAEQILSNTESNLMPFELMEQYSKFNARKNWNFKEHMLPSAAVKRGNRVCYEPVLEKSRELLKVK